jgi:hypothetical protein
VLSVLEGFNGTILAYGQTGSGKTYSMEGGVDQPGVVPRAVQFLYQSLDLLPETSEVRCKVSVMEIYNEKVKDLIAPGGNLQIREEVSGRGVYVEGLTEVHCYDLPSFLSEYNKSKINRVEEMTNMNEHSSRSHMIVVLSVEVTDTVTKLVKV